MNFDQQRQQMVELQLKGRGIFDSKVLQAFLEVPRHQFVPEDERDRAYEDYPLPVGEGQTISQPYMVALMTQALNLKGDEKVLEVGTGSGYQAAILSKLSRKVYSIERIEGLAKKASERLKKLGFDKVEVVVGDGTKGLSKCAPFDAIIVTAGANQIPKPLINQLAEGGRLVIPVGNQFFQELVRVTKKDGKLTQENLGGCRFVPLIGEYGWRK